MPKVLAAALLTIPQYGEFRATSKAHRERDPIDD
jgi:hypothetical protein